MTDFYTVNITHAVPNIPLATPGDLQLGLKAVPSMWPQQHAAEHCSADIDG
jgi:hypothetical protein